MDKDLKNKWVAALRSGEYKQGKIYLRGDDDRFCCLGVLADLCEVWEKKPFMGRYYTMSGKSSCYYGPKGILDRSVATHLWHMNDKHEKTFQEIATWIEVNL